MKKYLLPLMGMLSLHALAQTQIEAYSVYDVNHDHSVQVDDAVSVANDALSREAGVNAVVDVSALNELLQSIDAKLAKLESIEARLSAIESKQCACSNCGGSDTESTPGQNGIIANGHAYVDLGLKGEDGNPIYWATCNVGADKPEDYGLYLAWGETEGYGFAVDEGSYNADWNHYTTTDGRSFDWASYSKDLCGGYFDKMKKYCTNSDNGTVDGKIVLDTDDDAAHVNWQGSWRMPTWAELYQLTTACTWTWDATKRGYTVTGPSGKSIFLPTAGWRNGGGLGDAGSYGYYWSSSLETSYSNYACFLCIYSDGQNTSAYSRCCGWSVRPVCQ